MDAQDNDALFWASHVIPGLTDIVALVGGGGAADDEGVVSGLEDARPVVEDLSPALKPGDTRSRLTVGHAMEHGRTTVVYRNYGLHLPESYRLCGRRHDGIIWMYLFSIDFVRGEFFLNNGINIGQ